MEKPADLSPDRSDRISKYLQKLPRQLLQVFFLTLCLPFSALYLPFPFSAPPRPCQKGSLLQKGQGSLRPRAVSDMLSLQVEVNADMQVLYTCAAFPFFIVFFPVSDPSHPSPGPSSCRPGRSLPHFLSPQLKTE
jgi:hypothetical protein